VAFFFHEDIIVSGDLFLKVSNKGKVDLSKSSFLSGGVDPGQMGVDRVYRKANNLTVDFLKFLNSFREGNDFSWANKGEIFILKLATDKIRIKRLTQGIENKNNIFS
jgi:hypothetical protein